MGKQHNILFSIVAAALFCLAATGFTGGCTPGAGVDRHVETTGTVLFVAEELPMTGSFELKEGAGFFSGGNLTPGSFKQSQVFKAVIRVTEVQVACTVLQIDLLFNNNPIRIRKEDMLFPFHYFFETLCT